MSSFHPNHLRRSQTQSLRTHKPEPMMSTLGAELQKAPSLQHTRHQLQRGISDVHIVPKYSPFHHHHHHHHHHHSHRDRGEDEEKTVGSNLSASFIFDGTKSEGVTPNVSRNGSRRTSVFISADDNSAMSVWQREKKAVKPGVVKAEKERGALRAAYVVLLISISSANIKPK